MDAKSKSFDALEKEILDKLEARGCSEATVTGYRYLCNSVISQLKLFGYEAYTKGGGECVLNNYLKAHGQNQYYSNLRTVVKRLDDLLEGTWRDIHSAKGKTFALTESYSAVINKYCDFCKLKGLADAFQQGMIYNITVNRISI